MKYSTSSAVKSKRKRDRIFLSCFLLCSFAIGPIKVFGQPVANKTQEPQTIEVDLQVTTYTEHEFLPQIDQDIYIWTENTWALNSRFNWHAGSFSVAWKETSIEQKNKFYDDLDFSIKSKGPVFGVAFPLQSKIFITSELSVEKYEDGSKIGFYSLNEPQESNKFLTDYFYNGFFQANYSGKETWTTLSYNRSRDTDPTFDPTNNRAELNIRAKEVTGISTGWLFQPEWEIGGSVFFEHYETGTPDQFNINSELTYRPQRIKQLHLSIGSGYFTEEEETIINFAASYGLKWQLVDVSVEYQFEYSDNERSYLHEARASLKYYINQKISLFIQGDYGKETGDDQDSVSSIHSGLTLFF